MLSWASSLSAIVVETHGGALAWTRWSWNWGDDDDGKTREGNLRGRLIDIMQYGVIMPCVLEMEKKKSLSHSLCRGIELNYDTCFYYSITLHYMSLAPCTSCLILMCETCMRSAQQMHTHRRRQAPARNKQKQGRNRDHERKGSSWLGQGHENNSVSLVGDTTPRRCTRPILNLGCVRVKFASRLV